MMKLSVLLLASLLAPIFAWQSAAGRWEGVMIRGRSTLPIVIAITDGDSASGRFTAGDIGAMNVPLARLRLGARTHWELVGDHSTAVFDGEQRGDSILGTFTDGGTRGTFKLHRVSTSAEPPYTSEEVHFDDRGVTLAGTVLRPRSPGKHPGVVFLHGSGPEGRWANAFVADYLARNGIVALIYDKRGVGGSTGDGKTSTLEDLARDGQAAVDLLARDPEVDSRTLGIYGHSQGGFIAPIVAADSRVRWIIDADGNVGPQYWQDMYRVRTALEKRFHGDTLRAAWNLYREFLDVARNDADHAKLRSDIARARPAAWVDALAIPDDGDWIWNWYAKVGNDDNRAAWARVKVPVFLLYGGNDEVVPAKESIKTIGSILAANGNHAVTVRVLPHADHTLRIPPSDSTGWPRYAPGFPAVVRDWIDGR